MTKPVVGDVYNRAIVQIKALREQSFRQEAARVMLDNWLPIYPCFRCLKFHGRNSAIGKKHGNKPEEG